MNNSQFKEWFDHNFKDLHLNTGLKFLNKYSAYVINNIFYELGLFKVSHTLFSIKDIIKKNNFVKEKSQIPLTFLCNWMVDQSMLHKNNMSDEIYYSVSNPIKPYDLDYIESFPIAKQFNSSLKLLKSPIFDVSKILKYSNSTSKLYADNITELWNDYFSHPGMQVPAKITALYIYENLKSKDEQINFMEVGSGSASGTLALYDLLKEKNELHRIKNFYITDYNSNFIEGCRQLIKHHCVENLFKFEVIDLNNISNNCFSKEKMDIILGINCFHYVKDWSKGLEGISHMLNAEGKLIISGYFRSNLSSPFHIELIGCIYDEYWNIVTIPELRPEFGIMPIKNLEKTLLTNNYINVDIFPEPSIYSNDIKLDFYCGLICGTPKI